MNKRAHKRFTSISEQAAEWLVELEDGGADVERRRAFLNWCKQSPLHIKEIMQVTALQVELGRNERLTASVEELVALVHQAQDEVVELGTATGATRDTGWRSRWRLGLAASVVAISVAATWALLLPSAAVTVQHHRTDIGEQRSLALSDGSMITLNTQSEIRVAFDDDERRVTLVAGEALFDVAKDPQRPFLVAAGSMDLTVVGTQFNVYRQHGQTALTVVEGSVSVEATAESALASDLAPREPELMAQAGDHVVIASSGSIVLEPRPDVAQVTAWTERRLIFNDRPLGEVAAEFNRYNHMALHVDDAALAERPIRGVFNAHDTEVLVVFLENQPGIRVERSADGIRVLSAER